MREISIGVKYFTNDFICHRLNKVYITSVFFSNLTISINHNRHRGSEIRTKPETK